MGKYTEDRKKKQPAKRQNATNRKVTFCKGYISQKVTFYRAKRLPDSYSYTIRAPHRVPLLDVERRVKFRHVRQRADGAEFRGRVFIAPHLVGDHFRAFIHHPGKRV